MDYWKAATGIALGVALALLGAGIGTFASVHVLASEDGVTEPTLATLAAAALVVLGLTAIGLRSRRHRENPYW